MSTPTGRVVEGPALWSAQAHMPSVVGRQLVIVEADGCYITTADGLRLYDGTAGLWHANVGHSRSELAEAANEQMRKVETYHIFGRFANDKAMALAERLAAMSPIPNSKVILNSGGSDAIDVACKLARRHWQREGKTSKTYVLSREYAYHGLHAFGTSIAGLDFNRAGYGTDSLVPETARVPLHDLAKTTEIIDEIGAENIAALVTEPIQGTGGVHPPQEGYLQKLAALCRQNNVLLILDEVITGFGRTGTMFAAERFGVTPDMMTFAKGVTSGYAPLGGVLVSPRIWEPFFLDDASAPIFRHGSTYAGHATAAAVAMRNLDILEQEALIPRVKDLEHQLVDELNQLAAQHPSVTAVRVGGFLGGVELSDQLDAVEVTDALIDRGYVSRPLRGNTLQISPPFVTTDSELSGFVKAIGEVLVEREDK